jgi:DNA mismatch repair ATPase MutL
MEVRFASEQNIFRSIYHAIQEKLDKVSLISTDNVETPNNTSHFKSFSNTIQEPEKKYYTGSGTKFKAYSPYSDKTPNPSQVTI